jgi:hypothetical protein
MGSRPRRWGGSPGCLDRLISHVRLDGVAITGGVGMQLGMARLGRHGPWNEIADLDLVAADIEAIASSVTERSLVSHYHAVGPGVSKFMIQLVDPVSRLRVDVFPDLVGSLGGAQVMAIGQHSAAFSRLRGSSSTRCSRCRGLRRQLRLTRSTLTTRGSAIPVGRWHPRTGSSSCSLGTGHKRLGPHRHGSDCARRRRAARTDRVGVGSLIPGIIGHTLMDVGSEAHAIRGSRLSGIRATSRERQRGPRFSSAQTRTDNSSSRACPSSPDADAGRRPARRGTASDRSRTSPARL